MRAVIILFLLVIFYCLGSGAYYLTRRSAEPTKLAKALTWRISLSLGLFVLLFIAYLMGWIHPHGFYSQ